MSNCSIISAPERKKKYFTTKSKAICATGVSTFLPCHTNTINLYFFHFHLFMFHEFGWRKAYFYNRISKLEFCFVFRYAASGHTLRIRTYTRRRFLVHVRHGTNQANKQINTHLCGSLNKSRRRLRGLGETNFESTSQCDGINYINGNGAETEMNFACSQLALHIDSYPTSSIYSIRHWHIYT